MSWHPPLPSVGVMDLAVFAGVLSTGLFAMSYLPMLVKAVRTKDLSSYSFGNLAVTNLGNVVYSFYVFSLPFGPIWFLHSFYLVACGLMLGWFLHYGGAWRRFIAAARSMVAAPVGRGYVDPIRRAHGQHRVARVVTPRKSP